MFVHANYTASIVTGVPEKHYVICHTKQGKTFIRYYRKPIKSAGALSFIELMLKKMDESIGKWKELCRTS